MSELAPGFVLADGLCYPMEAWVWYLNLAVLEHLESRIPEGASLRQVVRALRSMKNLQTLQAVHRLTVRQLESAGVEGILPQAVEAAGGVMAGVIPLDKPEPPR